MKNKKCFLLFLVSLGIYLSACQKEISVETVPLPGTVGDSNYLDKIFFLAENGIDSEEVQTFYYDASHRLTSTKDSVLDGSSTGLLTENYYYSGTDTLPYKYISVDTREGFDSSIAYFFYNSQGQKITDSVREFFSSFGVSGYTGSEEVSHYKYAPGKIFGNSKNIYLLSDPQNNTEYRSDTAILDTRGNIILSIKNGSTQGLDGISTFTYDNSINIFTKLGITKTFPIFTTGYGIGIGNNNLLTSDEPYNGSANPFERLKGNFIYSYNSAGYPVILNFTYINDAGVSTQKLIFKYKTL